MQDEDCVVVHLTLIPYLKAARIEDQTQHIVLLSQEGVNWILLCVEEPLSVEIRKKFCFVM
jgi:CTP synthase